MRKNNWILTVFLFLGLIAGTIVSHLLDSVQSVAFLTRSTAISWHPKADFNFLNYEFMIQVKLNLLHLIGLAAAAWVYRKI